MRKGERINGQRCEAVKRMSGRENWPNGPKNDKNGHFSSCFGQVKRKCLVSIYWEEKNNIWSLIS